MMATVHESGDGFLVAVKGAPEAVLAAAMRAMIEHGEVALDDAMRAEWLARADQFGHHGLRVLACAMKMDTQADGAPYEGLVLIGLIGLEDPARADVPPAIRDCRQAGIRVVMVTGDHAVTARSIGRAVGIGESAANVVEGKKIAQVIDDGQPALRDVGIFARVSPAEKLARQGLSGCRRDRRHDRGRGSTTRRPCGRPISAWRWACAAPTLRAKRPDEITRNGWLWGALVLCAGLLATPPYFPPVAHLLQLAPLTADMWSVIFAFSLAPLIVAQATMVVVGRRHTR